MEDPNEELLGEPVNQSHKRRLLRIYQGSTVEKSLKKLGGKLDKSPVTKGRKLGSKGSFVTSQGPVRESLQPDLSSHGKGAFAAAHLPLDIHDQTTLLSATNPLQLLPHSKTSPGKLSVFPSFTPLPPLLSTRSPRSTSTLILAPSATTSLSDNLNTSTNDVEPEAVKLSPPIIVLISVGAVCLLLGVGIILKACKQPRKKRTIKPSLPILEKGYADDDDFGSQESPMFGGKERLTANEKFGGEGPLWTWVQYSKPDIASYDSNSQSAQTFNCSAKDVDPLDASRMELSHRDDPLPAEPPQSDTVPSKNRGSRSSLRHGLDNSAPSASYYTSQKTSFTGDGQKVLQRLSRDLRRSQSYSGSQEPRNRHSTYRPDSAYEGADVSSPPTYYQPIATPTIGFTPSAGVEGRARIQSSYFATGTYPRLSSVPVTYSINTATKVNLSQAQAQALPSDHGHCDLPPLEKDLGLVYSDPNSPRSSYVPSSPQPTLYPDDSLSVIASKRTKRASQTLQQSKRTSKLHHPDTMPTYPSQASVKRQSKGLLEMDFEVSRMSLGEIAGRPSEVYKALPRAGLATAAMEQNRRNNRDDKPPRVPSPPPLPSLTQMALAHNHPEAYNNYRSPTYSICGLYGPDRKSGATQGGGF
ncbi:hypothetical protein CC2G_005620 [Coprinopsis cinerea AmutBmut pab1-1]|nr:hypothetical protein CC2G_005620 [Coprinopsis cinerea AmutBmut pab1-1]